MSIVTKEERYISDDKIPRDVFVMGQAYMLFFVTNCDDDDAVIAIQDGLPKANFLKCVISNAD